MNLGPFTGQSKCINMSVTTTASASVALPGIGDVVRIVNEGPNNIYFAIGVGSQTATVPTTTAAATCTPVLAGTDITFSIPWATSLQISAICRTGTATIDIQCGTGV